MLPTSVHSDKRGCICLFDRLGRELEWIEGSREVLFMLVCVWNPTPVRRPPGSLLSGSDTGQRLWVERPA